MSRNDTLRLWLPVVVWAGVIFFLSSRPGGDFPSWGIWVQKSFHVAEYALLAALLYRALRGHRLAIRTALLGAWVVAILYAASDEIHQLFIASRSGALTDVGIDAAGAALGLTFVRLIALLGSRQSDAAE